MTPLVEWIKQLRLETGAGVLECRRALEESAFDYVAALDCLRRQAAQKAAAKSSHEARQGRIELYAHNDGRIGSMVEIGTETEFASRSEVIRQFAREIALQVTAAAPRYVRDEDIPAQVLDEQAEEAAARARSGGKPEKIIPQIVEGTLEKFRDQNVLLRQAYIRDETTTIAGLLSRVIAQVGENVVIRRFARWEIAPEVQQAQQ